eukprot:m.33935 g.33935  ORF g.33935 m.33935 type:complete len:433 (+) comp12605_c0_seq1:97-1395(+)
MAGTFDESLLRAFAELTIPPAVTAVLEMNALTQLDAFDGLTQDDLVDAGLPKLAAKRVFSTVLPAARGFSGAGGSRQSGAALSDSFSPERSSRSQTKSGGRAHLNNSGRARGTKELIGTNFGDVCTYTGELLDGKADGQGRLVFPNGTVYDGAFQNDRRNGFGTSTFIDDDGTETYAGEWRDGKRHGRATFTFADGDVCVSTCLSAASASALAVAHLAANPPRAPGTKARSWTTIVPDAARCTSTRAIMQVTSTSATLWTRSTTAAGGTHARTARTTTAGTSTTARMARGSRRFLTTTVAVAGPTKASTATTNNTAAAKSATPTGIRTTAASSSMSAAATVPCRTLGRLPGRSTLASGKTANRTGRAPTRTTTDHTMKAYGRTATRYIATWTVTTATRTDRVSLVMSPFALTRVARTFPCSLPFSTVNLSAR